MKAIAGGTATIPSGSDGKLSVLGLIDASTTHTYQGWYRDAAVSYCTANTFNLTSGVFIVWAQ